MNERDRERGREGKRVNFAQIEFEIAILERKLPAQKGFLLYYCMDLPNMPEKMSEGRDSFAKK